ncbi:MAG: 6-bladed beta-propeller [Thermomicrobiales bacterium]
MQVFSNVGVYLGSWGTTGAGPGQFDDPRDIVVWNNQVYVTDYGNERVQIFDLNGSYVGQFVPPSTYEWPKLVDIAIDPDGYIYIQNDLWYYVYSSGGAYLDRYRAQDQYGNYVGNNGLTFGPDGNMYVVDSLYPGLYVFDVDLLQ